MSHTPIEVPQWVGAIFEDELCSEHPPLTRLAVRWRAQSEYLSQEFDLDDDCDRRDLALACQLLFGTRSQLSAAEISYARQPCDRLCQSLSVVISNAMYAVWRAREDVQAQFALDTPQSQASFVIWFLCDYTVRKNVAPYQLSETTAQALNSPDPRFPGSGGLALSKAMHLVWLADWDNCQRYDLNNAPGRASFAQWFLQSGAASCGIDRVIAVSRDQAEVVENVRLHYLQEASSSLRPMTQSNARWDLAAPGDAAAPAGLNLIGPFTGDFGFGEHARATARAVEHAGLRYSAFNCMVSSPILQYTNQSMSEKLSSCMEFSTSVFVGSPYWFTGSALTSLRQSGLAEPYRIYFGAWELECLPASYSGAINYLFHEAWAQSQFQFDCLSKSLHIPVTYIPLAVCSQTTDSSSKADYGLPEDRFMFLYVFDGASRLARKNPGACVEAFLEAFPEGDEKVMLVLKSKNISGACNVGELSRLQELISRDERIIMLDMQLSQARVAALQSLCDAYVSLHRAEGFGLTIAEAMLMGKPVIATGWSGNMDYCNKENSCPVDYQLVPVSGEDFPLGIGQRWAQPDVAHAAWCMRKLFFDSGYGAQLGSAARIYMQTNHGLSAVGSLIRARLEALHA